MNYYVCDFETSVYDGQTDTEVWAAACVKIHTEDVLVVNSIDKYWEWIEQLKTEMKEGDIILVKASHFMDYPKVVAALTEEETEV